MKIGIIGAGHIGGALTRRLRALGHDVAVANSRGPQTLAGLAKETGAHAVTVKVIMPNGRTVSHHNKAYKGRLARVLVTAPKEPTTLSGLVRAGTAAGLTLRQTGDASVDLVVTD